MFLNINGNEKTLKRQVSRQFEGKRQFPFAATHHEIGHGREDIWAMRAKESPEHIKADWPSSARIVELLASGSSDGKPFKARHLFITSLHTTPEVLLRLIRERWSIVKAGTGCDTQLDKEKLRYRGNGAGVLATLRAAALNVLRLARIASISEGLHAVMHYIKVLLTMTMRQPRQKTS